MKKTVLFLLVLVSICCVLPAKERTYVYSIGCFVYDKTCNNVDYFGPYFGSETVNVDNNKSFSLGFYSSANINVPLWSKSANGTWTKNDFSDRTEFKMDFLLGIGTVLHAGSVIDFLIGFGLLGDYDFVLSNGLFSFDSNRFLKYDFIMGLGMDIDMLFKISDSICVDLGVHTGYANWGYRILETRYYSYTGEIEFDNRFMGVKAKIGLGIKR